MSLSRTVSPTMESAPLIPIRKLAPGQTARIARIIGPPQDVHRLEELGLRRGTSIQMFRQGDPCILRLDGIKVCLRAGKHIEVLVTPALAP